MGKTRIKTLCSIIRLGSSYLNEALELYDRLYGCKDLKMNFVETKICLSIWCVYITCRRADMPITMTYMASVTGYPIHKLFRVHNACKSYLKWDFPAQDITELVDTVVNSEIDIESQYTESTKRLTKELLMLCRELWLTDGRKTHYLIAAAFFIAWQAEDFIERKKAKVSDICKRSLNGSSLARRVNEFKKVLCHLADHIPWVTSKVTRNNIGYYVKDLAKYQRSLLMDAFRQKQVTDEDNNENRQANSNSEEHSSNESTSTDTSSSIGKACLESPNRTTFQNGDAVTDKQSVETEITETISVGSPRESSGEVDEKNPEQSASDVLNITNCVKSKSGIDEENLFVPPAFKRARRKSMERKEILEFIDEGRKLMSDIAVELKDQ